MIKFKVKTFKEKIIYKFIKLGLKRKKKEITIKKLLNYDHENHIFKKNYKKPCDHNINLLITKH